MALVRQGLTKTVCQNAPFRLQQKLKVVRGQVKGWSKVQGQSMKQVELAKAALDKEASKLLQVPNSEQQAKAKVLQEERRTKLANEEADLRQRSKVNWLKLGDSNTKFLVWIRRLGGQLILQTGC